MTAIEKDLQDHEPRIVSGVKGVRSKPFKKRFKNSSAMEKWMDSDDFDHEIHHIQRDDNRAMKEETTPGAALALEALIKNEPAVAVDHFQSLVRERARDIVSSIYAPRVVEEEVDEEEARDAE